MSAGDIVTPVSQSEPPAFGAEERLQQFRDLLAARRKRREERPFEFYRPMPHQARFHASLASVRLAAMANRAGKSQAGVIEDIRYATGEHPHRKIEVPNTGWVVSVSGEAQRDILQPKFQMYLPKGCRIVYRQHGTWDQVHLPAPWHSIIGFKSVEMGRGVLQGAKLRWVHCDEEPPEDIFAELMIRLTDLAGDAWLTLTPIKGMTWIYDRFVDPGSRLKGSEIITGSMWDNTISRGGYLPDEMVKQREEAIPDPVMRRIRIYGEFHSQVGRVYKSFDHAIHGLKELPQDFTTSDGSIVPEYDVYCGIDTGRNFGAAWIAVDYLGNAVLFDEYYAEDKPISEHARTLLNMASKWGCSPTWICDRTSQFFNDLAEYGIVATHADNDREQGVTVVQEYMHVKKGQVGLRYGNPGFWVVLDKCPRFLWEVQRYQYESPALTGGAIGEKKNTPRKKDDHVLDPVRYILASRPAASRPPSGDADQRPLEVQIRERVKARMTRDGRRVKVETQGDGLNDY